MKDDEGFNRLSYEDKNCFDALVDLSAGSPFVYIRRFIHALLNLLGIRSMSLRYAVIC
jgi:hypothetical protein